MVYFAEVGVTNLAVIIRSPAESEHCLPFKHNFTFDWLALPFNIVIRRIIGDIQTEETKGTRKSTQTKCGNYISSDGIKTELFIRKSFSSSQIATHKLFSTQEKQRENASVFLKPIN